LVNLIQPGTWEKINALIVKYARDKKGFKGHRLRLDTTAVETDIHFPMDASLRCDCVRVWSRLLSEFRRIDPLVVGPWRFSAGCRRCVPPIKGTRRSRR